MFVATRRYRFADGTTVQRGDEVDGADYSEAEFLKVFQMGVLAPQQVDPAAVTIGDLVDLTGAAEGDVLTVDAQGDVVASPIPA